MKIISDSTAETLGEAGLSYRLRHESVHCQFRLHKAAEKVGYELSCFWT